jgi:hypothetical protein
MDPGAHQATADRTLLARGAQPAAPLPSLGIAHSVGFHVERIDFRLPPTGLGTASPSSPRRDRSRSAA